MEKNSNVKRKTSRVILIILGIVILLFLFCVVLTLMLFKPMGNLLTTTFSEPLSNTTVTKLIIDQGDGNLTIDGITGSDQFLATGNLQYFEKSGAPVSSVSINQGHYTLSLKANARQPWPRLPWAACNGATEWEIHLNPLVSYEISTQSGGGNVKLDLTKLTITHLETETGGGNMEIILPDNALNLDVTAKVGAGKVTIAVGNAIIGRNTINANSGLGEITIIVPEEIAASLQVNQGQVNADSRFIKINESTYETINYADAANRVEIIVGSSAGKVNITSNLNLDS